MDLATLIGLVGAIGIILTTIMLGGSATVFINTPSLLIVLGGTVLVVMMKFSLKQFLGAGVIAVKAFVHKSPDPLELIAKSVELAEESLADGQASPGAEASSRAPRPPPASEPRAGEDRLLRDSAEPEAKARSGKREQELESVGATAELASVARAAPAPVESRPPLGADLDANAVGASQAMREGEARALSKLASDPVATSAKSCSPTPTTCVKPWPQVRKKPVALPSKLCARSVKKVA